MVLVGEQTTYISHLPMFGSPHDYQAIFEVTLSKAGSDPLADYVKDRQENPPGSSGRPDPESKMYGLAPMIDKFDADPLTDAFVLTDLVTPADPLDPQSPPIRTSFKAGIFRGHFETFHPHEKGGPQILDDVVVQVTNAVVFRKFNLHAQPPPQLEYILFGKGQELFLTHVITGPPDFDQILGVEVDGHQLTDAELRRGVLVTIPGRENAMAQRLNEGDHVTGQTQVPASKPDGPRSATVQLRAATQVYFETDDLVSGPDHHM